MVIQTSLSWLMRSRKLSLMIGLLILHVRAATNTAALTKLERTKYLDDYTCLAQDLITSAVVWDVSMCAHICVLDDACITVFYNPQERTCSACSARYTTSVLPLPAPGYIHFDKWHQNDQSCDEGWVYFGGSCYTLSSSATFADGASDKVMAVGLLYVKMCKAFGAHPVFVETIEENEFLKTFLKKDESNIFWYMGMIYNKLDSVWRYYGTSENATYFDFHADEPNGNVKNEQLCTVYINGYGVSYQWGDHHCLETCPTICEKTL